MNKYILILLILFSCSSSKELIVKPIILNKNQIEYRIKLKFCDIITNKNIKIDFNKKRKIIIVQFKKNVKNLYKNFDLFNNWLLNNNCKILYYIKRNAFIMLLTEPIFIEIKKSNYIYGFSIISPEMKMNKNVYNIYKNKSLQNKDCKLYLILYNYLTIKQIKQILNNVKIIYYYFAKNSVKYFVINCKIKDIKKILEIEEIAYTKKIIIKK